MKLLNILSFLFPVVVMGAVSRDGHCPYKPGELKDLFNNKSVDNFSWEKITGHPWMTLFDDVAITSDSWTCPSVRFDQMGDNKFLYMLS